MLFLAFRAGEDHYVIEGSQTVEVLPLVQWKRIPHAPAGVAGVFSYHGTPVPLIDLTDLMLGTPSRQRMSTRIIVVNYPGVSHPGEANGKGDLLGLLAEQVTETIHLREEDFHDRRLGNADAPYLGKVATRPNGMLQRIDLTRLLPEEVRTQMFSESLSSQNMQPESMDLA